MLPQVVGQDVDDRNAGEVGLPADRLVLLGNVGRERVFSSFAIIRTASCPALDGTVSDDPSSVAGVGAQVESGSPEPTFQPVRFCHMSTREVVRCASLEIVSEMFNEQQTEHAYR